MNVAFKDPQTNRSLDALAEALLLPSGIEGVYARTAVFEDVVTRLAAFISRHREPGTEVLRFPPVMSRRQLERSGYLKSFPHFLGCICCLERQRSRRARHCRALRSRRGLDRRSQRRRSRADAGRLLSGLSDRGEPRRSSGRRAFVRCRQRLFPPRTVARYRPAAILPHARIRLRRHARANRRFPQLAGWCARKSSPSSWDCRIASITPATLSLAAAASSWR